MGEDAFGHFIQQGCDNSLIVANLYPVPRTSALMHVSCCTIGYRSAPMRPQRSIRTPTSVCRVGADLLVNTPDGRLCCSLGIAWRRSAHWRPSFGLWTIALSTRLKDAAGRDLFQPSALWAATLRASGRVSPLKRISRTRSFRYKCFPPTCLGSDR